MAVLSCLGLLVLVGSAAAFLIWAERKIAGRIQDRYGPTRVGGRFGWLQSVADGIKILGKEDIIPASGDRLLFRLAPYLAFVAAFSWYIALPFSDRLVVARTDIAALFVVAVAGLEVYAILLGGYASGGKWSLIGGMRETVQVISYEIPLTLGAIIPVVLTGSMDLVAVGEAQKGGFWNWYIFHNPFAFLGFWVFVTAAAASLNRAPFDLPEAESELVSGYMTEYSGFRWAAFMLSEYIAIFAMCLLTAVLFLGAWHMPLPIFEWFGWKSGNSYLHYWMSHIFEAAIVATKALFGAMVLMWARWSLPRLRIDQVMIVCLKYCLPLGALAFIGCLLWQTLFPGGIFSAVINF